MGFFDEFVFNFQEKCARFLNKFLAFLTHFERIKGSNLMRSKIQCCIKSKFRQIF